jgi:hypothetical protein
MRLWTFHPKYLDRKGLLGLWRECCTAKSALTRCKGYRNHPQLMRFKATGEPLRALCRYMISVFDEGIRRGYRMNSSLIPDVDPIREMLPVTSGQLQYELDWIRHKLAVRSPGFLGGLADSVGDVRLHDLFYVVPGDIEEWERVKI